MRLTRRMWRQNENSQNNRNRMSEPTIHYTRQNGNGKHAYAADIFSAGAEIEAQYRTAAEVLFAAVMREPHLFATVAHKMHPAWWRQTKYDKAAQAVFEQFYSPAKSYSAYTVCKPGGDVTEMDLFDIQGRHADTDLPAALDFFLPIYRQWVEFRAAQFAAHGISQGWDAEQIRRAADDFRRDSMAYMSQSRGADEWYEKWFAAKMRGDEPNFKCKPALDTLIRRRLNIGYEPGMFYVRAARNGMGKTTLTLNDLLRFMREGARGVFLTLDMNTRLMKVRLIGIITGYTHDDNWVVLTDQQRQQIIDAKNWVDEMNVVWIDDTNDVNQLISTCYAEHYKQPIDFVIIDFLQKVKDGHSRESRTLEIGGINTKLKLLANNLNIPVIALAQILQDVERRGGSMRPTLADIRDSGSVADDADVVEMIYRPEKYGILEDTTTGDDYRGKAEIIYAKQRMRAIDSVWVDYNGIRGFSDPEEHEQGKTLPPLPVVDFSQARPKLDEYREINFVPF